MSHNPYAPPTAAVADPPPISIPRPREVAVAVRLLWLSFGLGLSSAIWRQSWVDPFEMTVGLVSVGFYGAILAWLIFKFGRGRNWARIVYTVLLLFGYVSVLMSWTTYAAPYHGHPAARRCPPSSTPGARTAPSGRRRRSRFDIDLNRLILWWVTIAVL